MTNALLNLLHLIPIATFYEGLFLTPPFYSRGNDGFAGIYEDDIYLLQSHHY